MGSSSLELGFWLNPLASRLNLLGHVNCVKVILLLDKCPPCQFSYESIWFHKEFQRLVIGNQSEWATLKITLKWWNNPNNYKGTPFCTWIRLGVIALLLPFHFCTFLNTYTTYTWKITHLVKLQHSKLPYNFGLFSTFGWVGLKPATNFPSGARLCCLGLSSFIFQHNHILHLVWRLNAPRLTPRAPFLKPSLTNTYAACEFVKPKVKPSPTFRFIT